MKHDDDDHHNCHHQIASQSSPTAGPLTSDRSPLRSQLDSNVRGTHTTIEQQKTQTQKPSKPQKQKQKTNKNSFYLSTQHSD